MVVQLSTRSRSRADESPRTATLYDSTIDAVNLDEIERIQI
jgi:hypothetical protein